MQIQHERQTKERRKSHFQMFPFKMCYAFATFAILRLKVRCSFQVYSCSHVKRLKHVKDMWESHLSEHLNGNVHFGSVCHVLFLLLLDSRCEAFCQYIIVSSFQWRSVDVLPAFEVHRSQRVHLPPLYLLLMRGTW